MKKEEGRAYNLTSDTDQKILEVGKSNNETKINDKTSFENFKTLYAGKIAEKCLADYGTDEDKDLLEDTAKEMYLTSQELIPTEDTKSEGVLEDEKTKKEEGKMELDNKSKFLAHILNGVVSDIQDKFNVTATGELDTANTNKVVVTLKGNTLDLIDATSYLAKAIRRDDVDFTFEDTIKNNTVKCTISPKSIKTEGVRLNKELVAKMDDPQFQYLAYFADNIDGIEKVIDNCTDKSKIKAYKEILKSARAFNSGRTKTESKLTEDGVDNDKVNELVNEPTDYKYQLLSRMISDCEYYLGNGNRHDKYLWAGNVQDQIKYMKAIYNSFKNNEKPEWTSIDEIDELERQMTKDTKTEAKDGKENPEYKSFSEDMNEIERTINFIKQPKNKDAQEVLADIKDYLNKLWVEKEQHTFGIKYDESKKITEETATIDEISKIHSEINQANSLKEIQDVIDKISDKSLQRQVQITFDEYDKDDNEDMDEDLEEVKDEIIQTLEDNAEYDDEGEPLTEASTPNIEKFIYNLDVDSGNAWSVNYNDRKRGVEVYKNGKSEKTVDDIIKAVTSKYPQLKVSMKGKNTVLFKYDDKNKSLKEESPKADKVLADIINDEKDSVEGYRDTIMEMGLSKEDFIDMITTENEHKLMNEKGLTKDQEAEVYGKLYDAMI